jgi:K+:H+ antiporter
MLMRLWPWVIGVAALLITVKIATNVAASLAFGWSVPGSVQLGFLLAQAVQALLGEEVAAVLIGSVALTLAATPTLAEAGRSLAGRMRRRAARAAGLELQPKDLAAPVFIVGMGWIGRTLADALNEFSIGYVAIERDDLRFRDAMADGYAVIFGDSSDPRIWEPIALHGRRLLVLTAPSFEISSAVTPMVTALYPALKRIAAVRTDAEAEQFRSIGISPVIERGVPRGLDLAVAVLKEMGIDDEAIGGWMGRQRNGRCRPVWPSRPESNRLAHSPRVLVRGVGFTAGRRASPTAHRTCRARCRARPRALRLLRRRIGPSTF